MNNRGLLLDMTRTILKNKNKNVFTNEEIEETLNKAKIAMQVIYQIDVGNKEFEYALNEILASYQTTLDKSNFIEVKHKKWFLNKKGSMDLEYWDRYKTLLKYKGFNNEVVEKMEDVMDDLSDLIGNPKNTEEMISRRGLVIGDVQSGKTANFAGLICRAADIGFKVIIVLAGTVENLRRQTQMRLDEAFLGVDSDSVKKGTNVSIGVGIGNKFDKPILITTKSNDFSKSFAQQNINKLSSFKTPMLAVVKKNVNVLKNLNNWFKTLNSEGSNFINQSVLVIDDESDYASLNTKKIEDLDPTATNAQIRQLLKMFTRSSYVGYTATPFANVFVSPDTISEVYHSDLFPEDYIYCLEAPSNYIGARNVHVLDEEEDYQKYHFMVKKISDLKDNNTILPLNHKKDFVLIDLPNSLKESIYLYMIANVIRDIRGDENSHRSMLINVSRFVDVHKSIYEKVNSFIKQAIIECKNHSKSDNWRKSFALNKMYELFEKNYNDLEISWEDILYNLYSSVASIKPYIINSSKNANKFNYDDYDDGARIIAIGGFSLSRGITLEGLIISYMYRTTKMYDTLLQMGRWFGYRDTYSDLCRIYITESMNNNFKEISLASDELRHEIKVMESRKETPKEFGLKVRSSDLGMLITARNKMRSTEQYIKLETLSGDIIEITKLSTKESVNQKNLDEIINLISKNYTKNSEERVIKNVNYEEIFSTLENLKFPYANIKYDVDALRKFVENNMDLLSKWDVGIVQGRGGTFKLIDDLTIKKIVRKYRFVDGENSFIQISGRKNRLGGIIEGALGLDEKQISYVKGKIKKQSEYFSLFDFSSDMLTRNPMLFLYFIELGDQEGDEYFEHKNNTYLGISIGIPKITNEKTRYIEYTLNKVAINSLKEHIVEFEEEE